jgi:hypothetical protein
MTSIVVGAGLSRRPLNGGGVWARLQWFFGLRRLGCEVYIADQLSRDSCVGADGAVTSFERSLNLAYFREIVDAFGLRGSAALIYGDGEAVEGATAGELLERAESADLLINIAGKLDWEPLLRRFRRKAYVDIDPGFTQFSGTSASGGSSLADYEHYFTIGQNVGRSDCLIPAGGILWRPIRPPVALDQWPVSEAADPARFTTVATWRGRPFGSLEHKGRTFGLKAEEFRKFAELPRRVEQSFEIALNLDAPKPLLPDGPYPPVLDPATQEEVEMLTRRGWRLVDPRIATPNPVAFRRYVQESGAEFSAAKGIYVETSSGWFSDRTACYLASGKPVLVQDTGLGGSLPLGEGLLTFRTLDEAVAGAREIARNYRLHSEAARAIAEHYFDSDAVLAGLLDDLPSRRRRRPGRANAYTLQT